MRCFDSTRNPKNGLKTSLRGLVPECEDTTYGVGAGAQGRIARFSALACAARKNACVMLRAAIGGASR